MKYDVAISFAGEQRPEARDTAEARALNEKGAYILPVRFDDTDLPGLPATIKYLDFSRHGAKGICDAFLRKTGSAVPVNPPASTSSCTSSQLAAFRTADSPQQLGWFPVLKARWGTQEVTLVVQPEEPSDEVFLNSMRAQKSIVYVAYQNNIARCRVVDGTHISEAGQSQWDLSLQIETSDFAPSLEMNMSGMSADKMAEIRARRLLLNERPNSDNNNLNAKLQEAWIQGQGTPIGIAGSIFPNLFQQYGNDPKRFLDIAWILAALHLKLSGSVVEILRLQLTLKGDVLEVDFSGRRKRQYQTTPAYAINICGNCSLTDRESAGKN